MPPEIGIACHLRTTTSEPLLDALHRAAGAAEASGLVSWWALGDRETAATRSHDATLGLHVVATATRGIRIGLSGDIPSLYSAPVRAKQIASLDWFSGGRVEQGIDLAPPPVALTDPLRPPAGDHLEHVLDQTAAMQALWTERRASYSGATVSFEGAIALPKPVGDRRPATHLRSTDAPTLRRYVDACGAPEGWIMTSSSSNERAPDDAVLREVLGEGADRVRTTWLVAASALPAVHEGAGAAGVDEVVVCFDHIPTPSEIETLVR